ncbi:MAG: hypothetical protein IKM73_15175 [Acidaminococcaceae bacterium]|nr:hypothetical protein [Acidaminococcaceae bacterium]
MKRLMLVWVMMLCLVPLGGWNDARGDRLEIGLPVEPVGIVPEPFVSIVENNLFGAVALYGSGLFVVNDSDDVTVTIHKMDEYGHILSSRTIAKDELRLAGILGTSDGGSLVAMGFDDSKDKNILPSKLIKFDANGNTEWIYPLEGINMYMLRYLFETDEGFCIIGNLENAETKIPGVFSPTDVAYIRVSPEGTQLETKVLGGTGYDTLLSAKADQNGFLLCVCVRSQDGDFAERCEPGTGTSYLMVMVDREFRIVNSAKVSEEEAYETTAVSVGLYHGEPVYDQKGILAEFDTGVPELFIDYGEYYLVVSSQYIEPAGDDEPWIIETIYSAFDQSGVLLWRAVDQSVEEEYEDAYGG